MAKKINISGMDVNSSRDGINDKNRVEKFLKNQLDYLDDMFTNEKDLADNKQRAVKYFRELVDRLNKSGNFGPMDRFIKKPGYFYIFGYESKLYNQWKRNRKTGKIERKLPFYDAFPLVLVIQVDKTGFYALNWHWLHPRYRAFVLQKILIWKYRAFYQDLRMIPMNWKIFKHVIGDRKVYLNLTKQYVSAFRRYTFKQLRRLRRTKVLRIPAIEIMNAINYSAPYPVGITIQGMKRKTKLSSK